MEPIDIRLIAEEDCVDFYHLVAANRIRLQPYFPATLQALGNEHEALRFVMGKRRLLNRKLQFYFVVVQQNSGNIIGMVNLRKLNWSVPKGEVSYFIDGTCEGKGYATAALKCLVDFAFQHLGLVKLYAQIDPQNEASARVAIRCSFEKEGHLKQEFRTGRGELRDIDRYGLVRGFWQPVREKAE